MTPSTDARLTYRKRRRSPGRKIDDEGSRVAAYQQMLQPVGAQRRLCCGCEVRRSLDETMNPIMREQLEAGVVGGQETADHELARLNGGDGVADLFHDAAILVTDCPGAGELVGAAVGP